jgi:hypothetical protein
VSVEHKSQQQQQQQLISHIGFLRTHETHGTFSRLLTFGFLSPVLCVSLYFAKKYMMKIILFVCAKYICSSYKYSKVLLLLLYTADGIFNWDQFN